MNLTFLIKEITLKSSEQWLCYRVIHYYVGVMVIGKTWMGSLKPERPKSDFWAHPTAL